MVKLIKLHLSVKENQEMLIPISDIITVNPASDKERERFGSNSKVYYSRSAWIGGNQILVPETLDEIMSMVNDFEGKS